ncbi:MAG: DNA adenine methylase [Clostridiaceae bacterium]|nr:DNA adenine methylase [Clostridiaceae bacterium]
MKVVAHMLPFIKWPGGKEKELTHILPNLPNTINRYIEPFVGGGAVYLSIDREKVNNLIINDFSEELIDLYTMISEGNNEFFCKLTEINRNWILLQNIVEDYASVLISKYKDYSDNTISKLEFDDFITEFILHHSTEFNGILSTTLNIKINNFIKEIEKNLISKTARMKKIETSKGKLPDSDILDNMECAFKSGFYMHLRYLYNSKNTLSINRPFRTAIFYFIREYCYSSMFRYNNQGKFNVPYGGISYNRKDFMRKIEYLQSEELFKHVSATDIYNMDFEDFLNEISPQTGDFIFLDPPYDSDFSTYANNDFTAREQERLAMYLKSTKANFMLVIKNTDFIYNLYKDFNVRSFNKKYLISFQNRNDKNAKHLMITNY